MSVKRTALPGLGVAALTAAATAAPPARRWAIARLLRLPPATHRIRVDQNLRVPVEGGLTLATDVYHPVGEASGPAVLVRTPYGRQGWSGALAMTLSRRFAERGYRVVCQDVRGRFDSDGEVFLPYIHEQADGAATVAWIRQQDWSDGRIVTWGPSYLGYVQWAVAAHPDTDLVAMVPITTSANIGAPDPGEVIALDTILRWIVTVDAMENTELPLRERISRIASPRKQQQMLAAGFERVPLAEAAHAVLERESEIWQLWAEHAEPDDALWQSVNHTDAVAHTAAAVHFVTGWFDLFLTRQLDDYNTQINAGRKPYLTIGPWHHLDPRMQVEALRLGVDWFDEHLGRNEGNGGKVREAPVRVWVSGANQWREYAAWPPPSTPRVYAMATETQLLELEPESHGPGDDDIVTYRFDPADPTPSLGGALLSTTAGSVDNRELEARDDVVVWSSAILDQPLEVIGTVCVRLRVSATSKHFDLVARVCDVHPNGRSMNLADGFVRLNPEHDHAFGEDGVLEVALPLAPLAHRFGAGHRVRLQLASGAHPRIARNLGTGESALRGTDMVAVEVTVHAGATVELPVT